MTIIGFDKSAYSKRSRCVSSACRLSCKFQLVDKFPLTGKCLKRVDMFLTNRQNVDMFLTALLRTGSNQWTSSRLLAQA